MADSASDGDVDADADANGAGASENPALGAGKDGTTPASGTSGTTEERARV